MKNPSIALMRVWQMVGSLLNGPTLNSVLGMVRLNVRPCCEVKAISITAGSEDISEHGMPKVPDSPLNGLMFGEMRA